jgi:hypothetical protein
VAAATRDVAPISARLPLHGSEEIRMQNLSFALPTIAASLNTTGTTDQKELIDQQATAAIVCCYLDYRARQGDSTTSTTLQIADLVNLINDVQRALYYPTSS